jgi:hypothetical protein
MTCPVCGARCVCRKADAMCCSCHKHKARSPLAYLLREIAHAARAAEGHSLTVPEEA